MANNAKTPNTITSMLLSSITALIAVNFTHPIEVCKTRIQVGNLNIQNMIKNEGMHSFWKGIRAAYFREVSYTSIKLGGYGPIKKAIGATDNSSFFLKFIAGAISGSLGSIVGNPFDVLKIKGMTNERSEPLQSLVHKMYKDQGLPGFYRGLSANVARACVLNGTKMACYDQIKGIIVNSTSWGRKDIKCQFTSAIFSGFFMTCTVAPFDMIRTTLMNQPTNKRIYNGFTDAFTIILRDKGPLAFYRGFFPIWGRFAPQATLQLVIFDNLLNISGYQTI